MASPTNSPGSFNLCDSTFLFLEDSGIHIQTKRDSPQLLNRKPPKVQRKRAHIARRSSRRPKSLLHPGGDALIFPSRNYDATWEDTYLYQCFDVLDTLGEGHFGIVYKVCSRDSNTEYAVKVTKDELLEGSTFLRNQATNEVLYHHQLSGHPNIVTLYQAWEESRIIYMQLELCLQSLEQYSMKVHDADDNMIRGVLFDICSALEYMHEKGIVHLDIKLANILIASNGVFKLADFGLAIKLKDIKDPRDVDEGDSKYLASEIFRGHLTEAADIFALGISMLELACDLILPGQGEPWQELRKPKIPQNLTTKVSNQVAQVIVAMMDNNFEARPTAHQILEELLIEDEKMDTSELVLNEPLPNAPLPNALLPNAPVPNEPLPNAPVPNELLPSEQPSRELVQAGQSSGFSQWYSSLENFFSSGYQIAMDRLLEIWESLHNRLFLRRNADWRNANWLDGRPITLAGGHLASTSTACHSLP